MNQRNWIILTSVMLLTGCTTMMPELGIKQGQLTQCPKTPNCVSSQAKDKKQSIEPVAVTGTPLEVKNRIVTILNQLERSTLIAAEDNYVRAAFTSTVFRFVDDVEFYFPDTQSKETTVHMRSASRVGYSDLGANRRRLEHIRSKLATANESN